jgi:hypothetical protein
MGRGLAQKTLDLRDQCYTILEEIHPATVRAVCYRLFVLKAIPNMSTNSTGKISRILTAARKDGFIPWEWIVDETRELERAPQWNHPTDFAQAVKRSYRRDLWVQQPQLVEIWSEKGTMRGTLGPVLDRYGVGFRVMHGFGSTTVMKDIADATSTTEAPLRVFYIGDWDPSGMCMSERDIPERLNEFGANVEISRLALVDDDLRRPELMTTSFPAADKKSDSRYRWFVNHIGHQCWEVDALSPVVVRDRVEAAIVSMITDKDAWTRYQRTEEVEIDSLQDVLNEWARLKAS